MTTFNTNEVNDFVQRYKAITAPTPAVPQPNPAIGGAITRQGTIDNSIGKPLPAPTVSPYADRTNAVSLLDKAKSDSLMNEEKRLAIRREADLYASQQRQARIDAINQTFAPRIKREEEEGINRLARVDALNFNRGIVGSGADTTAKSEQKGLNDKALEAIEQEKALLINDAFNTADKLATERATLLTSQRQEDADANVKLYQEQSNKAIEALKVFGGLGKTRAEIEKADPNTIKTLKETSGLSDSEIDALLATSAPVGTYQWGEAQVFGSKMVVPKIVNGKVTMEKLDLGFTPSKEIKSTTKLDNGDVLLVYNDGTYSTYDGASPTDEDAEVIEDLKMAQAALDQGADHDKVRRAFLDKFPKKGDLFLKYTKQAY